MVLAKGVLRDPGTKGITSGVDPSTLQPGLSDVDANAIWLLRDNP